MIRTIIIKTKTGYGALMARVRHEMSPDELVRSVEAAVKEFSQKDPGKYRDALVDGKFPWSRLFTHMDQGLLERRGIDLREYGCGWLEIEDGSIDIG